MVVLPRIERGSNTYKVLALTIELQDKFLPADFPSGGVRVS